MKTAKKTEKKTEKKAENLISDAEFERQFAAAEKRTGENPRLEPRAVQVIIIREEVEIVFESGWSICFDPRTLPEFKGATVQEATDVKILGAGYTLEWTALDAHLGAGTVVIALLGDAFVRSEAARMNGKVTSAKRAAASRVNGQSGGRPKKKETLILQPIR